MAGLFDTFTIGKRGLNVQQAAINTTSHNIANANTEGYSRQRAVAETTRPFGGMSRFDSFGPGQMGTGAEISTIQRIRDTFIDYQVRSESGTKGFFDSKSVTLTKVEDILGEPSDKGIQELMSQFYSAFQEVSKNPDKTDVKAVAMQKASALADAINYSYNQLKKNCVDNQKTLEGCVVDTNSYLDQINHLNKQIRSVVALGQAPNDLMDKRDNLLDKLSLKFGIKIDKDSLETINLSSNEYPGNALVKSDPNDLGYNRLSYVTDNGVTALKDASGNLTGEIEVQYYPLGDKSAPTKTIKVEVANASDTEEVKKAKTQEMIDKLADNRILIADKDGAMGTTTTIVDAPIGSNPGTTTTTDTTSGVTTTVTIAGGKQTTVVSSPNMTLDQLKRKIFKTYEYDRDYNNVDNNYIKGDIAGNQLVQQKIKGYMNNLDVLAAGLAYTVNAIQTGSLEDGKTSQNLKNNLIFVAEGKTKTDSNNNLVPTDDGVTAANIRINSALLKDTNLLNCRMTATSGEGDGKRADAIANLNMLKMDLSKIKDGELNGLNRIQFLDKVGIKSFSDNNNLNLNQAQDGTTVNSYYKTIINNLAVETQESGRQADIQEGILGQLQQQKLAVSGVSLDEEVTNLIQFQHAYQANAKIISTINDLLDVVINGLKR